MEAAVRECLGFSDDWITGFPGILTLRVGQAVPRQSINPRSAFLASAVFPLGVFTPDFLLG